MAHMAADPETGLTPKMEAFCLEFAKTGNATASYKKAYDAKNMKDTTIARRALELTRNGNVAARLSQLRSDLRAKSGITLEEHLEELRKLRELAKGDKQYGAAITAETGRGKVSGLYVEKTILQNPDGSPLFSRIERVILDPKK